MQLMQLAERLRIFKSQHPKVLDFMHDVVRNDLQPGVVMELRVTDNDGKTSVTKLLAGGRMTSVTEALGALGLMVVGSMIASNVSVVTPLVFNLGQTSVNLQAILDTICPKLLSLITVFITYRMVNKGVKPIRIIIGMFVIGIIGGLLGIIG